MNTEGNGADPLTGDKTNGYGGGRSWVRPAVWSAAALILLLPLVATQFTDEVNWTARDFVFAAALILAVAVPFDFAARKTGDSVYLAALGVALAASFFLVWLGAGVGIIGADGDPANLMYLGVLVVGVIGAFGARFQPRGMARAMLAAALAQGGVAAVALGARLGYPFSDPLELLGLHGIFIVLFIGSAWLFQRAGGKHPSA